MTRLGFENPSAWIWGLPLAACAIVLSIRALLRQGRPWSEAAPLAALRSIVLFVLVCLAARPLLVKSYDQETKRDRVVLLLDASESMSLANLGQSRYEQAVELTRTGLVPGLKAAGFRTEALLFAEDATTADGRQIAATRPAGKQTNLGRAILRALSLSDQPPLALVALTDGVATEEADNPRAISALMEQQVRLLSIGFGREIGEQVLALEQVAVPRSVSPKQEFTVSARLRSTGRQPMPAFDLLLLRDGQLVQKKTIPAAPGARVWQESFSISENSEKFFRYTVQVVPPSNPHIKCPSTSASAMVRVEKEKALHVLFVQGALTWDYKFIRLALSGDRSVRLSGLSRTASGSSFFESSEDEKQLVGAFPRTSEELGRFRVVVLSDIRSTDLTPAQQELLASFCGHYGGGVLMIGGPDTFNASWRSTPLEQLLPVRFAPPGQGVRGNVVVGMQLTRVALGHPVFQIGEAHNPTSAWANLPRFSQFAVVESVKPGAEVWAVGLAASGIDSGPPLMACQRYGAGLSAVICLRNFWQWRLAKRSDPQQFDRFWQQLFRHLGEGARELVSIIVPDQRLQPGPRIRLTVQRRPDARSSPAAAQDYRLLVKDEKDRPVADEMVELRPGASAEIAFPAHTPGLYAASVSDAARTVLATRSIEISDVSAEFDHMGRDMEALRQWAAVSDGLALRSEDCSDTGKLIRQIKAGAERPPRDLSRRTPLGINGWVLLLLAGCLCGEWSLRKRWELR